MIQVSSEIFIEKIAQISATTDEYAKLFIFETDTDCNTHDLMGCTCTGVIDEQKENDEVRWQWMSEYNLFEK